MSFFVALAIAVVAGYVLAWNIDVDDLRIMIRDASDVGWSQNTRWELFDSRSSSLMVVRGISKTFYRHANMHFVSDGASDFYDLPIDVVFDVRIGYPLQSHSFSAVQNINSEIRVSRDTGILFEKAVIPYNVNVIMILGNAFIYTIPLWMISRLCFIIMHLLQRSIHRCSECDYDLTGTSGRCPECGQPSE